jgi:hypothetical protein
MQKRAPDSQCPSGTGDDEFEELVRTFKLIPFLLPYLMPIDVFCLLEGD